MAWLSGDGSGANNVRPTSSKGQIQSPSYDLYREIKSLAEKEGLRMQTQLLVNISKPVKQCQKYFSTDGSPGWVVQILQVIENFRIGNPESHRAAF
jgi:hypothetical protein